MKVDDGSSAHCIPDKVSDTAQEKCFGVVIAAAGMAAALPGVVSAYTSLPVLGVLFDGGLHEILPSQKSSSRQKNKL